MSSQKQSKPTSGIVSACRSCGGALATVFADLGMQPPSNAYLVEAETTAQERKYPLCAKACDSCRLVQLDYGVPPEELFADYAYFSSYADSWLAHAKAYCEMIRRRLELTPKDLIVEIASNDGYLLRNFVARKMTVLGIDPSETVARAAREAGVPTLCEFFGKQLAQRVREKHGPAALIVANNVLAHVPAPNDFVAGIADLLAVEGTATFEFPHLLRLIEGNQFDTIYHEHFSYFSLLSAERLFARNGLRVYDVEELSTHGGSLRLYACLAANTDVAEGGGLLKVRNDEEAAALDDDSAYRAFAARVVSCRNGLLDFLARAKREGKSVAAYGAAAKGNTLLNYCGVDAGDIAMVADRSPHKQGKSLPGSHIPIVTPEQLLAARPDYVLILPWNLTAEITETMAEIRSWGGRFVTAIPTLEILS